MKKILLSLSNVLLSEAIKATLSHTGEFKPYFDTDNFEKVDIALLEVSYKNGFRLEDRLLQMKLMTETKKCLIIDDNSFPEIAREFVKLKKDGIIDYFLYSSVSSSYLVASLETLI